MGPKLLAAGPPARLLIRKLCPLLSRGQRFRGSELARRKRKRDIFLNKFPRWGKRPMWNASGRAFHSTAMTFDRLSFFPPSPNAAFTRHQRAGAEHQPFSSFWNPPLPSWCSPSTIPLPHPRFYPYLLSQVQWFAPWISARGYRVLRIDVCLSAKCAWNSECLRPKQNLQLEQCGTPITVWCHPSICLPGSADPERGRRVSPFPFSVP